MDIFKKIAFGMTILTFKIRDLCNPPENVVEEADIKEGYTILDYGCGYGSHSIAAAKLVGSQGKVYAVDISNEVISFIRKVLKSFANIVIIQTDCDTSLPEKSVDVVFLFDVYHRLQYPEQILKELHRVLKDEGVLSFSDHHMQHEDILKEVAKGGFFSLLQRGEKTYIFKKIKC